MDTHESQIYNLFLTSTIILLVILLYYIISIIRLQAGHRREYLQQLGKQLAMLEDQRKQLSENLHDDLAPIVTAAKMHISSVKTNPGYQVNLQRAVELLNSLSGQMRTLPSQLFPKIIEHKGLKIALEHLVYNLTSPAAPTITLDIQQLPPIPAEKSLLIFRILQEIIHNTCKHAKASQLHVHIYTVKNNLYIATADNGIGFNYTIQMLHPTGTGLTGLVSRVNLLQGTISVHDKAAKGTSYFIVIPLHNNQSLS